MDLNSRIAALLKNLKNSMKALLNLRHQYAFFNEVIEVNNLINKNLFVINRKCSKRNCRKSFVVDHTNRRLRCRLCNSAKSLRFGTFSKIKS